MAPKILLLVMLATITTLASAEPIPSLFNNPITKRTSHVKRANPANDNCDEDDPWIGRFCSGDNGPRAWVDICEEQDEDEDGDVQQYERLDFCPEGEECFPVTDADGDNHIGCVGIPHTPPIQDIRTNKKQYGKRKFEAGSSSGTKKQKTVSIQMQGDVSDASVSAHLMSTDFTFELESDGGITGIKRGLKDTRCSSGLHSKSDRQCYPVAKPETLKKGDWIDFTFGVLDFQSGYLNYHISGL